MKGCWKYALAVMVFCLALAAATTIYGNDVFIMFENDRPSKSIGTPAKGELVNGKRLPTKGPNFRACSHLVALLGRNSVHDKVRDAVVEAYAAMNEKHPDKIFVYGETGWPRGGSFPPHKTHQNGTSVDFMVPILDRDQESVPLPASVFNKFGYGIEFDDSGATEDFKIDFEAMAAHIFELRAAAINNGLEIERIIFDPELQPKLFETQPGKKIRGQIRFSTKQSWVRHDEHYHVDFRLR
jgi:penicillin-insensitive murein endopeptidase